MTDKILINRYFRSCRVGIELVDMDATSLAGYYLHNYPKDPIGALLIDIHDLIIPNTVGQSAKVTIAAVLSQKRLTE